MLTGDATDERQERQIRALSDEQLALAVSMAEARGLHKAAARFRAEQRRRLGFNGA